MRLKVCNEGKKWSKEKRRRRGREREREEKRRNNGASFKYLWGNSTRRLGGGTNRPALSNGLLSLLEYLLNSIGPIDSITLQCGWMVENNRRRLVRVY